jgi:hypothetical protein
VPGKSFGFIGPGYQTDGLVADSQSWLNMYLEKVESGANASPGNPYCARLAPGKTLLVTLDDGPVSCIVSSQSTVLGPVPTSFYAISGGTLYAITATPTSGGGWAGSATVIGAVASQPITGAPGGALLPSQIIPITPTLLFVVSAGNAYVAAYGSPITETDGTAVGSVATAVAGQGGAAYAVGDTGTVDGGEIPATYVVNSVDANGQVLTYTITFAGTGYSVATAGNTTTSGGAQPGNGTGFVLFIDAVGPPAWTLQQQTIPFGSSGNYINTCTWMDTYAIVSLAPNATDPTRRQFYYSDGGDPTTWNPLNFDTKEAWSDPVMAVYAAYEVLIVFGQTTIELWQDTGAALGQFQRIPGGGVIQNGLASPWAVCKMDGTVVWLGSDERGNYVAWSLQGVTPTRISNHAIESAWGDIDVTGMSVFSYVEHGHFFAVFHFPLADQTWVYDSSLGPALGWHQRASMDSSGNLHADYGRYFAHFPETLKVVGDYSTGNVYVLDQAYFQENGNPILRQRTSPHVATGLNWNFFDLYRLHCLQGQANAAGATCQLALSNDGGNTFGSPQVLDFPAAGDFLTVMEWYRQGRARNRVVQWSMTAPIDLVLVDLYADVSGGSG